MPDHTAPERIFSVLFLCTGNSARSILAESILKKDGAGRFRAYSAGSQPKGEVNPLAITTLANFDYPTEGLRSKAWDEFAGPDAPVMDFVFTVCDNAANEVCPVWPGQPMTAHWGVPDPAAVEGSSAEIGLAFSETYRQLKNRITAFVNLPMASLDQLFERELKVTAESIKRYEQTTYYAGQWKPEYDVWVQMLAGMYSGADGRSFAWTQARTADIIQSQPVVHEFPNIKVPTLVILGLKDNTANGRERASPEVNAKLGNYPELAKETAARIPGARLITFPDLAHSPHIQEPERFNEALLKGLAEMGLR